MEWKLTNYNVQGIIKKKKQIFISKHLGFAFKSLPGLLEAIFLKFQNILIF